MNHRNVLVLLGLMLIAIGLIERGWLLTAIWLGGDFLAVGIAHARKFHRIFGKRVDGSLPMWSWVAFLPFHLFTNGVWQILRLISHEPAEHKVTENLVIGRRQLPSELDGEFANYVDLTAEFAEPRVIRKSEGYLSFPILDGAAPDPICLQDAVNRLRPGKTFVHCAQGHGRTGLFALALLLRSGRATSVTEGLQMLRAVRRGISPSRVQLECADEFARIIRDGLPPV